MNSLTIPFGLGDLAHWVFRPAVYFIDVFWGTDLLQCEVCAKRRSRWNKIVSVPRWVALLILTLTIIAVCWSLK